MSTRRVLRKGTHSCWECKRRKTRCVLSSSATGITCDNCRRRGVLCISQEFSEKAVATAVGALPGSAGDSSIAQSPEDLSRRGFRAFDKFTTRSESLQTSDSDMYSKRERLSHLLHKSLPSAEDHARICKAGPRLTVLAHEVLTMPYTSLVQNRTGKPDSLLVLPGPDKHPVLIARYMLLLASFLQHIHPHLHETFRALSQPPRAMSERLANLAISEVTTNDELLGSIEYLECVMIESVYHANLGNLRRSWMTCRRAVSIAQLMSLDRAKYRAQYSVLDAETKYYPRTTWFRIVFLDSFLCLLLGFPQAYLDHSMVFDVTLEDSPIARLEQKHCLVASRILERNNSLPDSHDYAITQSLDLELQRAARSLSSKWWSIPRFGVNSDDSSSLFWDTRRIFAQVLHYNLLNQLHLPYMLRSSSPEHRHAYSRVTCVNASREVLLRFIALRDFNKVDCSCRIVDFLALMAAITLLLAHLDGHALSINNTLAHQYQSDRAMIEEVEDNMKAVNRLNSDAHSAHSIELLGQLLALNVESDDGDPPALRSVSIYDTSTDVEPAIRTADPIVNINIPYFGVVKVARQSVRMESHQSQSNNRARGLQTQSQIVDGTNLTAPHVLPSEVSESLPGLTGLYPDSNASSTTHNYDDNTRTSEVSERARTTPMLQLETPAERSIHCLGTTADLSQDVIRYPNSQHGEDLGLAAGGEDWALQGVDLAFFDSMMKDTGKEVSWGAEWSTDRYGIGITGPD